MMKFIVCLQKRNRSQTRNVIFRSWTVTKYG